MNSSSSTRVAVRVDGDAGFVAGMGHVYRSLAYIRRLRERLPGVGVVFLMRDFPQGTSMVRNEGHEVCLLPMSPTLLDYSSALGKYRPDLLVIDTLGSCLPLMEAAREYAGAVVTLDDLEQAAADADIIVNGIVWATRRLPDTMGRARVYQGIRYMQLRRQFADAWKQPRTIRNSVTELVVSTGGADHRDFLVQLIGAMSRLSFRCSVTVMVGPAVEHTERIRSAAEQHSNLVTVSVVQGARNMAERFLNADLAIITGGTVMFESAACGTPAIIVCNCQHQVAQAEWFHQRGIALNLGWFEGDIDENNVVESIEGVVRDPAARRTMSRRGKSAVDGKGLERFVDILLETLS